MPLDFDPPLLNSANPWATSKEDLTNLYDCRYTGAMTTRTSLIAGFGHNDTIHQYCFIDDKDHSMIYHSVYGQLAESAKGSTSTLNTLGYSPLSTNLYLDIMSSIIQSFRDRPIKPIIFSVAGTPDQIVDQHYLIAERQNDLIAKGMPGPRDTVATPRFLMEINLSCPNITGNPPPAYSKTALTKYLSYLSTRCPRTSGPPIQVGIKIPPYTHQTQFDEIISALLESARINPNSGCPISFITATNTLGNCLVLLENPITPNAPASSPALNSSDCTGIGGLAGAALHPLALGNVATLRRMLDAHEELKDIEIIGVGGVSDGAGYDRMRNVGASAVAVGTALGDQGVDLFYKIWEGWQERLKKRERG